MRPLLEVRRFPAAAVAVAYPLLAHLASIRDSHALTLASVAVLAATVLGQPLLNRRRWAFIAAPFVVLGIAALERLDAVAMVLFAPPVLLNAWLAWLFGHTLAHNSTPLIERLVRLLQPPGIDFEPGVIRYTRSLTRVWTALFVALGATSLALAIVATRETWSLFANLINYVIVVAFFALEYFWRRRRFPNRPYRNFAHFLKRVGEATPALVASLRTQPRASIEAPVEHPAYAGHFPGHPLLPGVVLLERIIAEATSVYGVGFHVLQIRWVKFVAPLAPCDRATVEFRNEADALHFDVRRGEARIANGVLRVERGRGQA
jgi:uncharacterized membrane protein